MVPSGGILVWGPPRPPLVRLPPEEEEKWAELELVFNAEHENGEGDLEAEARELLKRYRVEERKLKVRELGEKLAELDEESEEYEQVLRQIRDLQKGAE